LDTQEDDAMKFSFLKSLVLAGTIALAANGQAVGVGQRQENQQNRVANGVNSGQLTPGETSRVQGREAKINHEVSRDKAAHGGTLTNGERARVEHQQNRASRAIGPRQT
jgi:hypothetical protein